MVYYSAKSVAEALAVKNELKARVKPIAGGTDVIVQVDKKRISQPEHLLDVSNIKELSYIQEKNGYIHIGATTSQTCVIEHPLVQKFIPALVNAILTIGGRQIRNRATIVGNIVNASPAADTIPVLIAHDASLELKSLNETRTLPLSSFITGPGKTLLASDELVTEVFFPLPDTKNSRALFMKLGKRNTMNISAVNSVVRVVFNPDNTIKEAHIVLGSVFPGPLIPHEALAQLEGEKLTESLINDVARQCRDLAKPISDVRASAEYRKAIVEIYVRRSLNEIREWRYGN